MLIHQAWHCCLSHGEDSTARVFDSAELQRKLGEVQLPSPENHRWRREWGWSRRNIQPSPLSSVLLTARRIGSHPQPVSASGEASSQASSSPQDRLKSICSLKEALEEEEESPERGATPSFNVTLLDWINVQDRPNDVESVVRKCFDSINRVSNRRVFGKEMFWLKYESVCKPVATFTLFWATQ